MGEYQYTVTEPGLHAKVPFIQSAVHFENRVLVSDATPTGYLTGGEELEKKKVIVDHVSRYRIADALLFYKTVRTEAAARTRLQHIVVSELRDELAKYSLSQIISDKREPIMEAVADRTKEKVQEFGMELVDVRIKRGDLPKEVQASVFARMRAERERKAKAYRSEGKEKAFNIRAEADKEKKIILAEAYEESQTLKGEGDANATSIYANAFKKDPEFYDFLRSLEAYEKFLKGKTTLVLGSDSEIFRYLDSSQPEEIAAPETEAAPTPTPSTEGEPEK
ncbi:MAG: protease modulator HflC [Chloroflexota bacterium]